MHPTVRKIHVKKLKKAIRDYVRFFFIARFKIVTDIIKKRLLMKQLLHLGMSWIKFHFLNKVPLRKMKSFIGVS